MLASVSQIMIRPRLQSIRFVSQIVPIGLMEINMTIKDVFKFGLKIPHVIEGELLYERVRDNLAAPTIDEKQETEKNKALKKEPEDDNYS